MVFMTLREKKENVNDNHLDTFLNNSVYVNTFLSIWMLQRIVIYRTRNQFDKVNRVFFLKVG